MAPLLLFSSKASDDEEKSIVEALILSGYDWSVMEIICPVAKCNELEKMQIHEMVTSSTTRVSVRSLGLDVTSLSGHGPST